MSTPTKSQFIETAKVLNANVAPLALVEDFADMFAEENPRFNRVLFIRASTLNLVRETAASAKYLDIVTEKA